MFSFVAASNSIPYASIKSDMLVYNVHTHTEIESEKKVCKDDDSSIKIEFSCETVLLCNFPPADCMRLWNNVICFAADAVAAVCSCGGALCLATKVSMSSNAKKMYINTNMKSSSIEKLSLIRKYPFGWNDICVHVFDFASVLHCFICDPFLRILINFARSMR